MMKHYCDNCSMDCLQTLQPMLPILTALYAILRSTAASCASDSTIAPYFSSQAAPSETEIVSHADAQIEAMGALYGVSVQSLEDLASLNMAAFVLPSPSNLLKDSRKVMAAIGHEVCWEKSSLAKVVLQNSPIQSYTGTTTELDRVSTYLLLWERRVNGNPCPHRPW
jgi:hypothetical protein